MPTESEQQIKKLQETLGKMEVALGSITEAIVWTNREGRIQWCNRSFDELIGWPHLELLGADLFELLPLKQTGEAAPEQHPLLRALEKGEESGIYEFGGRQPRVVEVTARLVALTSRDLSMILVIRDVTQQKQAEEAQRKRYEFIQLLQAVAIAANEADSIEDAIRVALSEICSQTGWPIGHAFLVSPDAVELKSAKIWCFQEGSRFETFRNVSEVTPFHRGEGLPGSVWETGQPVVMTQLRRDPRFVRTRVAQDSGLRGAFAFPVVVSERVVAVLEFFASETIEPDREFLEVMAHVGRQLGQVVERQEAERLRIAKERAEEASQAKTQFLTRMSHELRTPLNSVIGFTNVLLKRSQQLGEKDRMYLERILVNSKHLLDLINGVLDISRVEAGRMDLDIAMTRVDQLVTETVDSIRAQSSPEVRLVAQIPERVVPFETDPLKLKQILMNLISNALRFTDKGSVTIRLRVDERTRKPVRIDVTDTGKGIPGYRLRRVFEPFEGKDTRLPTEAQGTGLGLTIVRSLCELLDYRIEVQSEVGRGTTFSIFLGTAGKDLNSTANRSQSLEG